MNGTAIGIVIDGGAVEAAEVVLDGAEVRVRRAARAELPAGAWANGGVADPAAVAAAVHRLLKENGLSRRNVSVALGGARAVARIVELSAASPEEAERTLQDRIARYAVFEDTEVAWQASALPETEPGRQAYVTAAAAAKAVPALLEAMLRAGVQVASVEPQALASLRALGSRETGSGAAGPTILVSRSRERADFLIVSGGVPLLIRSIEGGAGALEASPEGADSLLVEVRRSIEFCHSRSPGVQPTVWLAAGAGVEASAAGALLARLEEVSDAAVALAPAWTVDGAAPAAAPPCWAAVGAALGSLGRNEACPLLNLVPQEWPETQKVRHQIFAFVASVGAALLVTFGIVTSLRLAGSALARQVEAATVQIHRNTTEVLQAAEVKHLAATTLRRAQCWNGVRAHLVPFDWVAGLEAVVNQAPAGVRIVRLSARQGTLSIAGEARSPDDAHEFVRRLASLRLLDEAKIERLDRAPAGDIPVVRYTIACRFHETPAPLDPAQEVKP